MGRAATIALVLAALLAGYVLRGERPSRPVTVYKVQAECYPEPKRERPKTRLV